MKKIIKIQAGKELPIINRIGAYIGLIAILFFLLSGFILFAGTYLPLEMKLIYFVEVIHRNIYLTFFCSILLFLISSKLVELKKYLPTDLIASGDGLLFHVGQEEINIPDKKIHKLIKGKSYLISDKKVTIKTIGLKKYETRMTKENCEKLFELYPDRIY